MSALLSAHLEQIATCAQSIAELPFPGPKAFTNAILSTPDITRLIRDTEVHERALYQLASPETTGSDTFQPGYSTAQTPGTTVYAARQSKNRAVATVLGSELYERIQSQTSGSVDVDLLLHGAKKLADVYPVPGALDRIAKLQHRAQQLETNIAHYEVRVAQQRSELEKIQSSSAMPEVDDALPSVAVTPILPAPLVAENPDAMLGDIEQLEQRKKALEDRVQGMDRDLNALAR